MKTRPLFRPRLLDVFTRPYERSDLGADVMAGITVGLIALPLALALGIASIPVGTQTPFGAAEKMEDAMQRIGTLPRVLNSPAPSGECDERHSPQRAGKHRGAHATRPGCRHFERSTPPTARNAAQSRLLSRWSGARISAPRLTMRCYARIRCWPKAAIPSGRHEQGRMKSPAPVWRT